MSVFFKQTPSSECLILIFVSITAQFEVASLWRTPTLTQWARKWPDSFRRRILFLLVYYRFLQLFQLEMAARPPFGRCRCLWHQKDHKIEHRPFCNAPSLFITFWHSNLFFWGVMFTCIAVSVWSIFIFIFKDVMFTCSFLSQFLKCAVHI